MDSIKATPYEYEILGLLAEKLKNAEDFFNSAYARHGVDSQPFMNLLGVPAVQRTMERVAYGHPLTTGSGMTTRLRPDTVEAAMTLLPIGGSMLKGAEKAAMAAGRAGERYAERVVPQILDRGGFGAQGLLDLAQGTRSPLTVWHGSPAKFERFDPTKIGSGEGAQAYGYGHYVAESPEVAKKYQPRDFDFEESVLKKYEQAEKSRDYASMQVYEDFLTHKSPNEISETIAEAGFTGKDLINAQNALKEATKLYESQGKSALYKIDLPDDQISKMLNWDEELGKQTPEIKKLAKQYGLKMDDLGGDLVAAMNAKLPEGAEAMRSAGVPGIKYFDAQSRGGQQADTRNFVVFPKNESLLNILERNNEAVVQGGLL